MDVLSPQAQNRSPNLCMTRVFFLLQKPLHLLCRFPLYSSSLLDPKATPEMKFSPYFLYNLSKICCLSSPPSQINFLFPCYDQKATATILFLACQYCSTTCHFSYNPLQTLFSFFTVKYLPRLSFCICC